MSMWEETRRPTQIRRGIFVESVRGKHILQLPVLQHRDVGLAMLLLDMFPLRHREQGQAAQERNRAVLLIVVTTFLRYKDGERVIAMQPVVVQCKSKRQIVSKKQPSRPLVGPYSGSISSALLRIMCMVQMRQNCNTNEI